MTEQKKEMTHPKAQRLPTAPKPSVQAMCWSRRVSRIKTKHLRKYMELELVVSLVKVKIKNFAPQDLKQPKSNSQHPVGWLNYLSLRIQTPPVIGLREFQSHPQVIGL